MSDHDPIAPRLTIVGNRSQGAGPDGEEGGARETLGIVDYYQQPVGIFMAEADFNLLAARVARGAWWPDRH